ncbi:MAG TPA: lytic transglycosylase, partial [Luteimonas sp.]|nr:lytic transglycosylase [Luteimonas sp.]
MSVLVLAARWLLPASILACSLVLPAHAQSRRAQAAIDALNERMVAAETRYREALVKIGNADPAGMGESNAALEDMEDVLVECGSIKGCRSSDLLAGYKRLLKAQADAAAGLVADEGEGDTTLIDDGGVPDATGAVPDAASLLAAEDRRFLELVQMNPAVQAGIRRWLTDMRVALITSHENYQYM